MLIFPQGLKDEIIRQAKADEKREVCGLLAGREGRVEKVYKMQNTSETPELCYFMDAKEQFKIMKEMRVAGLAMLAIYHSHVEAEAYPSAKDVELAYYPAAAYVIISPKGLRAFRIVESIITEEEIKIV